MRSERLPRSLPSGDEVWGCGWRRDVSSKRNGILAESKRKALGDRPVTSATMQDPRENVTRKKLPAPGNRRQSSRAVVGGGQFQAAACMRPVQPLPAPPNPQGSLVHEPRRGSGVWGQLGHLGGGQVNACGLERDSGPGHGEAQEVRAPVSGEGWSLGARTGCHSTGPLAAGLGCQRPPPLPHVLKWVARTSARPY